MTETYRGYTIEIEQDDFVYDPLTDTTPEERGAWFVLKHNHYKLPFEQLPAPAGLIDNEMYNSWAELAEHNAHGKAYKFVNWGEHGDIYVRLQDDDNSGLGFDNGIAGVVFGDSVEEIESAFAAWKMYIEGDIWQVTITDPEGDTPDDDGVMGGIFGYEYAVNFAKQSIDNDIKWWAGNQARKARKAQDLHR